MAVPATLLAQLAQPAVPADSFFDVFAEAIATNPNQVAADLNQIPHNKLLDEVRDTIEFGDHLGPAAPQFRTHSDCRPLQPICGYLTAYVFVAAALFDLLVNGVSILGAPVPGAALAPGVPFLLPIVNFSPIPPGAKIDYVWIDGGAPSQHVSADMEWLKLPV